MLTLENFKDNFEKISPHFMEHNFLVAVSGGADSMVLAYLFRLLGLNFEIAHINYNLRGEDSKKDQIVVEEFCKINGIRLHHYSILEEEKPENSIQLWARNVRYTFFKEIMSSENINFLATAHHANDNLETFFINFGRGSGLRGLTGIPKNENNIIRPLLPFSKQEIYDFAKQNKIDFREDLSNQKDDYLRNKIRNKIIPLFIETNPNFLENSKKSIEYLSQMKDFLDDQVQKIFVEISEEKNGEIIIQKNKLHEQQDIIQYEIFRKFGLKDEKEFNKIFSAKTGSIFLSSTHQLLVNRNQFIITNKEIFQNIDDDEFILIEDPNTKGNIEIQISDYLQLENNNFQNVDSWKFDLTKIVFPLKLRHAKEGDIFQPIGMKGKKKLSKFFKDEKFSILAKPKIWLLCDGNDDILGIIPFRQDGRNTVNKQLDNILTIHIPNKK